MDITPFIVHYWYYDHWADAEIHPCCREDNVVDYAVWIKGKLEFTITKTTNVGGEAEWVVALKNADNLVDNELVQLIGAEIDNKNRILPQSHNEP